MPIKKIMIMGLLAAICGGNAMAKDITVVVTNNERSQRQELVEIDVNQVYGKMGIAKGSDIIVRNALGQEVAYQVTYDGKLLIDVAVRPCGEAR